MTEYRALTDQEIAFLEDHGCTADDWTTVCVADYFTPAHLSNVSFYGDVQLGVFDKTIEVSAGFRKHTGIRNVVLHDVTIGDNCLIENVGNYISNYDIHDDCYISNVGTIETTGGATFGQGFSISVLNEAGRGNIVLFEGLTAQIADMMVREQDNSEVATILTAMAKDAVERTVPERGYIGNGVKITNAKEVSNSIVDDDCEIAGASRVSNCTVSGQGDASSYIGQDVICENSIITAGSSVVDAARISNCFVGESTIITSGFSAESSVFFANCYMANGEACAAFCGPFTVSHHKSSLLIGCQYAFYNAGSATNFSNHAYKLGPIHYGHLLRGTKTGSGSHVLLPATVGAFSVVLGKVTNHPDTRELPFSYLIGAEGRHWLVPGRNLTSAGLYRDVDKWRKRDVRPQGARHSVVNYEWLNPVVVTDLLAGKALLEGLVESQGQQKEYTWRGFTIKASALKKGIALYTMAVDMYLEQALSQCAESLPTADDMVGEHDDMACMDVAGMVMSCTDYDTLLSDLTAGDIPTMADLRWNIASFAQTERRKGIEAKFFGDLLNQLGKSLNPAEIHEAGARARQQWIDAVAADADREFALGDVSADTLERFKASLQQ